MSDTDTIQIGECVECRKPVHEGEPQTMLEAWTGRNCYCPECLESFGASEDSDDD